MCHVTCLESILRQEPDSSGYVSGWTQPVIALDAILFRYNDLLGMVICEMLADNLADAFPWHRESPPDSDLHFRCARKVTKQHP
jgi:hypothetical protein